MTLADEQFTSQRNKRKRIRTVAEVIILAVLLYIIIKALFVFGKYEPFNFNNPTHAKRCRRWPETAAP